MKRSRAPRIAWPCRNAASSSFFRPPPNAEGVIPADLRIRQPHRKTSLRCGDGYGQRARKTSEAGRSAHESAPQATGRVRRAPQPAQISPAYVRQRTEVRLACAYPSSEPCANCGVARSAKASPQAGSPRIRHSRKTVMNHTLLTLSLLGALSLAACDKPTVVNVPAAPAATPGPAGPAGATGATGATGSQGDAGKPGDAAPTPVPEAASAPTK